MSLAAPPQKEQDDRQIPQIPHGCQPESRQKKENAPIAAGAKRNRRDRFAQVVLRHFLNLIPKRLSSPLAEQK
jgi:hypothetical protein